MAFTGSLHDLADDPLAIDDPPPRATDAVDPDRAAIEAAVTDPRAFAPVYERYFTLVYQYCRRRLDDDEAADATSLIFANALKGLPRYVRSRRERTSFRSWLFTIAHNVVIDAWRARRRDVSLDRSPPQRLAALLMDRTPGPEVAAIRNEARQHLRQALATLPERQREVLELRLAGLRSAEIADVLRLSPTAVRAAQYRAIGSLRTLLDPDHDMKEAGDAPF